MELSQNLKSTETLPTELIRILSDYANVIVCQGELESIVECQLIINTLYIHDVCFYKSKFYISQFSHFTAYQAPITNHNPPMYVCSMEDCKLEKTLPSLRQDLRFDIVGDEIFVSTEEHSLREVEVFDLDGNLKRVWSETFQSKINRIMQCDGGRHIMIIMKNDPIIKVYDSNGNMMYTFDSLLSTENAYLFSFNWPNDMVMISDALSNCNLFKHGKFIQHFTCVDFCVKPETRIRFSISPLQEIFAFSGGGFVCGDEVVDCRVFRLDKSDDDISNGGISSTNMIHTQGLPGYSKPFKLVLQRTLPKIREFPAPILLPDGRLCSYDHGKIYFYK